MTSQDSFGAYDDHYGQGARQHRSEEGETLYAEPVTGTPADPPPPTGQPYQVPGSKQRCRTNRSAPSQEDFARLCQDIGQGVSQVSSALAEGLLGAGGALGQAIGSAVDGYRTNQARAQERAEKARQQAELARQQAMVDARFGRISSVRTGGIVYAALGGILTLSFASALIEELFMISTLGFSSWLVGMIFTGAFFGLSLKLLLSGVSRIKAAGELGDIRRIMGSREAIPISELARTMGVAPQKLANSLKYMLKKGWIPEGRLDAEGTTLMVTANAYQQYLALREAEQRRRMEENPLPPQGEPVAVDGMTPKVAVFLKSGNDYLKRFRELDEAIDDEGVSQRIVAIEGLVRRILARAKEEPAVIDQLGRFADYYLPTTVKLLCAYDSLEDQRVQGENIESSRREIESTLDVLLQAYEKLLDATFADLSMDVSSEISVLNVVLAQEGLTQSPFDAPSGNNA